MAATEQYAHWTARTIRSLGQIPYGVPLAWQAARLYQHTRRLAQDRQYGAAGSVEDALSMLALSTSIHHFARWDGVRQAVQAGATAEQIGMALGISIDDARNLTCRIKARDLEPGKAMRRQVAKGEATSG
ncbi:hypothetical protein [Streptomyces lydicus]|uniref:hypothetical protein n=1 Tax=Streptomyces lydicus TaxID=47763 RepID=UPI0036FB36DD